jgi:hypothetical protein
LAAGVAIGPATGLVSNIDSVATVAEFGVVLFLFIIGLELKPTTLWSLRRSIFGSGQRADARLDAAPIRRRHAAGLFLAKRAHHRLGLGAFLYRHRAGHS